MALQFFNRKLVICAIMFVVAFVFGVAPKKIANNKRMLSMASVFGGGKGGGASRIHCVLTCFTGRYCNTQASS